jgi:hypothetical protein
MTESVELNALEINEVDEGRLTLRVPDRATGGSDVPVSRISLPVDDLSKVAVLSWRWDLDERTGASPNVSAAVRHAKRQGIEHLFLDKVSIDQGITGDALLEQVVEFSTLYRTVPVIAAYDNAIESSSMRHISYGIDLEPDAWRSTMRRPWLVSEARHFRFNPCQVTYVGHRGQGAEFTHPHHPYSAYVANNPLGEASRYQFGDMLERIWRSSFTHTILDVLCEEIGMHAVSDFRFILPEFEHVLWAAHERMGRNDYLLTAAILSNAYVKDSKVNSSSDIAPLNFGRYTRAAAPGGTFDSNQDILLDGRKVATWLHHYNMATSNHHCRLEVQRDAERTIFEALGLSDAEYQRYAEREEQRRRSLQLPEPGVPYPNVEVVSVEL